MADALLLLNMLSLSINLIKKNRDLFTSTSQRERLREREQESVTSIAHHKGGKKMKNIFLNLMALNSLFYSLSSVKWSKISHDSINNIFYQI